MNFPQRIDKHVTETSSYKIFSNEIPDSWIIREVTGRDYGVDCYIEIVNSNNQVTGELISVQLKGIQAGINWTKSNYYTFSGIKISTSNYWNNFPTPVFVCLVDIANGEVYFCPVKSEIRKNFLEYKKQVAFSYRIEKSNALSRNSINSFLQAYMKEKELKAFEREVITFVSNYPQYREFIHVNSNRDVFMGVENERILFLQHFYNNVKYLHTYFGLEWDLLKMKEYQVASMSKFGDDYSLHEMYMDEIVTKLEKKMKPIVLGLSDLVWGDEKEFWLANNLELFNVIINANEDGTLDSEW